MNFYERELVEAMGEMKDKLSLKPFDELVARRERFRKAHMAMQMMVQKTETQFEVLDAERDLVEHKMRKIERQREESHEELEGLLRTFWQAIEAFHEAQEQREETRRSPVLRLEIASWLQVRRGVASTLSPAQLQPMKGAKGLTRTVS